MSPEDLHDDPDETLPEILIAGLRRQTRAPFPVNPDRDTALRRSIRAHFAHRAWWRRRWWRAAAGVAGVAAALLLAVVLRPDVEDGSGVMGSAARSATAGDVDGNGRVDILDAFALARSIETGIVSGRFGSVGLLDQNGDGNVDRDDVEIVARAAVALRKG